MTVQFTLKGGKQLEARLRAIGKAPPLILREIGVRGVAGAKHRVHRKTGNLGRTIRLGAVTDTYVEIRAGGTAQVGYAAAVEDGARPHVILPKRRKALAWGGARTLAGNVRAGSRATNFARRVNHPGNKPYPFLKPGLLDGVQEAGLGSIVHEWNKAA